MRRREGNKLKGKRTRLAKGVGVWDGGNMRRKFCCFEAEDVGGDGRREPLQEARKAIGQCILLILAAGRKLEAPTSKAGAMQGCFGMAPGLRPERGGGGPEL